MGGAHRPLAATLGLLLLGLGAAGLGQLGWPACLRLVGLLLALGAAWRGGSGRAVGPLTAAVLVVGATQLALPLAGPASLVLWLGLAVVTLAGALSCGARPRPPMTGLESTGVAVALGILALSWGARTLFGLGELWPAALQWALYPVVWLALGRWLARVGPTERRWVLAPAALVFGLACVYGGGLVAAATWQLRQAQAAQTRGDLPAAVAGYRTARALAERVQLSPVADRARLGAATGLGQQGQVAAAKELLAIPADQVVRVGPGQWEGPTGALLFKNVACWTDLWLWEGTVAVELRARGQAAGGTWPRLQVELAGQRLGEIEVGSGVVTAYTFQAQVPTGRHRLQVSLVNGLWTSGGEHRWAQLDSALVRYPQEAAP